LPLTKIIIKRSKNKRFDEALTAVKISLISLKVSAIARFNSTLML